MTEQLHLTIPFFRPLHPSEERTSLGISGKVTAVVLATLAVTVGLLGVFEVSLFSSLGLYASCSFVAGGALLAFVAAVVDHVKEKPDAEAIRFMFENRENTEKLKGYIKNLLEDRAVTGDVSSILQLLKSSKLSKVTKNILAYECSQWVLEGRNESPFQDWVSVALEFSRLVEWASGTPLVQVPGTSHLTMHLRTAAIVHICLALSGQSASPKELERAYHLLFQAEEEKRLTVQSDAAVMVVTYLMVHYRDRTKEQEERLYDNMVPRAFSAFTVGECRKYALYR